MHTRGWSSKSLTTPLVTTKNFKSNLIQLISRASLSIGAWNRGVVRPPGAESLSIRAQSRAIYCRGARRRPACVSRLIKRPVRNWCPCAFRNNQIKRRSLRNVVTCCVLLSGGRQGGRLNAPRTKAQQHLGDVSIC